MCPTCRHEAAEVLRRAAAERTERQRAQEEQERRQQERAEDERRRREAEEALRQQELARARDEEAQRLEDARRVVPEAADRRPGALSDAAEVAFDPYAILGVARGAGFDAIQAAYEQARSKYDLEQVADLGFEITQHYMAKAQAVGRAFEMLSEHHRQTSAGASEDAHADHVERTPAL